MYVTPSRRAERVQAGQTLGRNGTRAARSDGPVLPLFVAGRPRPARASSDTLYRSRWTLPGDRSGGAASVGPRQFASESDVAGDDECA